MKKTLSLGLSTALALMVAGCASTREHRSTGQYIDDKAIGAKVKTALFEDPSTSGFKVNVEAFRGEVQLSGFVDTDQEKGRAAEIARGVNGVRLVRNNLVVKDRQAVGTPNANETGRSVGASADANVTPSGTGAAVDVNTGRATDRSNVTDRPGVNASANVGGAGASANLNTSGSGTSASNPAPNIQVNTRNGRAVIEGRVYDNATRQEVERHVRQLPGVSTVENKIEVVPPAPVTR